MDVPETPSRAPARITRSTISQPLKETPPSKQNRESIVPQSSFNFKFSSGLESEAQKILAELQAKTAEKLKEMPKPHKQSLSPGSVVAMANMRKTPKTRFSDAHKKQFDKMPSIAERYKRMQRMAAKAEAPVPITTNEHRSKRIRTKESDRETPSVVAAPCTPSTSIPKSGPVFSGGSIKRTPSTRALINEAKRMVEEAQTTPTQRVAASKTLKRTKSVAKLDDATSEPSQPGLLRTPASRIVKGPASCPKTPKHHQVHKDDAKDAARKSDAEDDSNVSTPVPEAALQSTPTNQIINTVKTVKTVKFTDEVQAYSPETPTPSLPISNQALSQALSLQTVKLITPDDDEKPAKSSITYPASARKHAPPRTVPRPSPMRSLVPPQSTSRLGNLPTLQPPQVELSDTSAPTTPTRPPQIKVAKSTSKIPVVRGAIQRDGEFTFRSVSRTLKFPEVQKTEPLVLNAPPEPDPFEIPKSISFFERAKKRAHVIDVDDAEIEREITAATPAKRARLEQQTTPIKSVKKEASTAMKMSMSARVSRVGMTPLRNAASRAGAAVSRRLNALATPKRRVEKVSTGAGKDGKKPIWR